MARLAGGMIVAAVLTDAAHAQRLPTSCLDGRIREQVRGILLEGIDAALKDQTARLFENRLHDREPSPERITRGMRLAIQAYARSRAAILAWDPPLCEVKP